MTNKLNRLLSLVMSIVMVFSTVSFSTAADEYVAGSTYSSTDPNAVLPKLKVGLVWSSTYTEKTDIICGKTAHTHSDDCKVESTDPEGNIGSRTAYYLYNTPLGGEPYWKETTKEGYDWACAIGGRAKKETIYYKCKLGLDEHTHTDDCYG